MDVVPQGREILFQLIQQVPGDIQNIIQIQLDLVYRLVGVILQPGADRAVPAQLALRLDQYRGLGGIGVQIGSAADGTAALRIGGYRFMRFKESGGIDDLRALHGFSGGQVGDLELGDQRFVFLLHQGPDGRANVQYGVGSLAALKGVAVVFGAFSHYLVVVYQQVPNLTCGQVRINGPEQSCCAGDHGSGGRGAGKFSEVCVICVIRDPFMINGIRAVASGENFQPWCADVYRRAIVGVIIHHIVSVIGQLVFYGPDDQDVVVQRVIIDFPEAIGIHLMK